MLKLKNISDVIMPTIESDYYIPIKIRFGDIDSMTEPRHCFSIRNSQETAMFEISIGEISGNPKYITLVFSRNINLELPQPSEDVTTEIGLPSFETKKWEDYYSIIIKDFQVYLYEDTIFIIFSSNKITKKIINKQVQFDFDKDNLLCSIEVTNITPEEMSILKESLAAMSKI